MGLFGRALGRATLGGAAGYAMTGDWGGAAAGAAMGGAGYGMLRNFGEGFNSAGMLRKGLGAGIRGGGFLQRQAPKLLSNSAFGNKAVMMGASGISAARRGFGTASSFIGRNATNVNKFGGHALAMAGVGSAALIGSSVLGSNR